MTFTKFTRLAMPALAVAMMSLAAPAAMASKKKTTTTATTTTATTTPATATTPATTTTASTTSTKTVSKSTAGGLAASQKFSTAAAAQASCPTDTVVWSSFTSTHSFHMSQSKYYGKTKHGAYVCQHAALAAGYHQSKT